MNNLQLSLLGLFIYLLSGSKIKWDRDVYRESSHSLVHSLSAPSGQDCGPRQSWKVETQPRSPIWLAGALPCQETRARY